MKSLRLLSILFLIAINGCEMVGENGFPDQRNLVVGNYEVKEYSELDGTMFYYDVVIYKSGSMESWQFSHPKLLCTFASINCS